jgi:hypothetical protein
MFLERQEPPRVVEEVVDRNNQVLVELVGQVWSS